MIKITIDNKEIEIASGATILSAAKGAGIDIPTLCYLEACGASGSCMVCAVQNLTNGRMIPSCAALCEDGMKIAASSPKVREFRQGVIELLLNEHRGDCLAPCQLACPNGIDISTIMHLLVQGKQDEAAAVLDKDQDKCSDCKAHCELACRRGRHDKPIAIRKILSEFAATGKGLKAQYKDSYNHRFGLVSEEDMDIFIKTKNHADSISEAARCLRCDCRSRDNCQLRHLASEYDSKQKRFGKSSIEFDRICYGRVVYEVGKCVKCGNCIAIGESVKSGFGPVFNDRGKALRITAPIGVDKDELFIGIADKCIEVCPTGALFLREDQ